MHTLVQVMKLMLTCPEDNVELEPVSLAINLAKDQKCAALISDGKGLTLLMKRTCGWDWV
tara:strand:- start:54 stop:233 length:180 start_codon:yes stop_codon:yes gene_type:complete